MKIKNIILLLLIFVIAFYIRIAFLKGLSLTFGYDQARDAFITKEIASGDYKIQGPPTSGIPGLFHGVLYYYLITPAYIIGHGDPIYAVYWISLINALGVFSCFILSYVLTKKITPSLISAFIFSCSFDAIQFSYFLSNVTMAIWFVPLIFIGLYLWINKSGSWAPALTGLAFGLSVQSDIAFYYYFAPILLWLLIYRKNVTKKAVSIFILAFIFAVSTMIVSEVKFGFPGIKGLIYLFTSQDATAQAQQLGNFLINYLNQFGTRIASTVFPFNVVFGGLVGILMIIYALLKKPLARKGGKPHWTAFLAIYLGAHIIALPFGGSSTPHIMIGAIAGISVFLGIFLWSFLKSKPSVLYLILVLIIAANLFKLSSQVKGGLSDMYRNYSPLSTELQVIDYTYQKANQKPFSISTLTSPLYINTLWSYLYNWYGKEKYGYVPFWVGRDQIGQLGDNLEAPPANITEHFFIAEPTEGIPSIWVTYSYGDQNAISKIVEEKNFGEIKVEERMVTSGE